jgi:NodT family efflux transporter outer membrane factor (OMF) lipoprotein
MRALSLCLSKATGLAALSVCLVLTSCRVGPQYSRPQATTAVPAYREGWKQAEPADATIRGDWWTIYNDPELNALEQSLNIDNQNIVQAFQNYMAARALVQNARAALFPTVSVGASVTRSGTGPQSTARAANSTSVSSYALPLQVSWEPDIFGRIRNTIREFANAAQVSAANLESTRLSAQASLAEDYFQLRGEDALQQLYDATVQTYQESLNLTHALVETGINSPQDIAQAETNLRTAQANAIGIGINRAQFQHAIALLIGQPASTFSLPVKPLSANPPEIPIGIPSQLLERRPDIASAERTMAEANALIGVGKAAYYPTISLTASAGTQTSDLSHLFTWPARFWSLGGSVSETVLDFGARRAAVQQYEAEYNANVASYRQTVLTAFREVEDYLAASRILVTQLQEQQLAVNAARQYQDIATTRYKTGVDTYLNVLTAQNALLNDQLAQVTLHTNQMTASAQLIAALGGGWNANQLPSEKDVQKRP